MSVKEDINYSHVYNYWLDPLGLALPVVGASHPEAASFILGGTEENPIPQALKQLEQAGWIMIRSCVPYMDPLQSPTEAQLDWLRYYYFNIFDDLDEGERNQFKKFINGNTEIDPSSARHKMVGFFNFRNLKTGLKYLIQPGG